MKGGDIRQEVYRDQEATDKIAVWTTLDNGLTADQLLGAFNFTHAKQEHGKDTVFAVFLGAEAKTMDGSPLTTYWFLLGGAIHWKHGRWGDLKHRTMHPSSESHLDWIFWTCSTVELLEGLGRRCQQPLRQSNSVKLVQGNPTSPCHVVN
jgi:hypothetical protein